MKLARRLFSLSVGLLLVPACKSAPSSGGPSPSAAASAAPADPPLSPTQLFTAYMSEKNCADRGKYILHPKENAATLEAHYKDDASCVHKAGEMKVEGCEGVVDGGYCKAVQVQIDGRWSPYCVKRIGAGFKIDWRCSQGFNPMSVAAFNAQRSSTTPAARLRVVAKLASYYNYEFANGQQKFYSLEMHDERGGRFTGYIPKASPDAPKLYDLVKDGEEHAVTVVVMPPPKPEPSSDAAVIARFVQPDWHESDDEYKAQP